MREIPNIFSVNRIKHILITFYTKALKYLNLYIFVFSFRNHSIFTYILWYQFERSTIPYSECHWFQWYLTAVALWFHFIAESEMSFNATEQNRNRLHMTDYIRIFPYVNNFDNDTTQKMGKHITWHYIIYWMQKTGFLMRWFYVVL